MTTEIFVEGELVSPVFYSVEKGEAKFFIEAPLVEGEVTTYMEIWVEKKMAEVCSKYLKPGTRIRAKGALKDLYSNPAVVIASGIDFIGGKK